MDIQQRSQNEIENNSTLYLNTLRGVQSASQAPSVKKMKGGGENIFSLAGSIALGAVPKIFLLVSFLTR